MRKGRSTSKPTKAEQERLDAIKEIGGIVARIRGLGFVPCEVHHLTTGGKHGQKRLGHDKTVGLNPWSHRGAWYLVALSREGARLGLGPSYAETPREFRALYPDWLLLEMQNEWLEKWKRGEV